MRGLQLKTSVKEIKGAADYVVRLADPQGKTLFIHSPDYSGDSDIPTLNEIEQFLQSHKNKNDWLVVPGDGYGDDIEVVSKILPTGETLQVGKDTEDREAFLQSFAHAYFMGLIPIFILAIAVGGFLSHRLLKPIRLLTQTVESLRSGNPKARVSLHRSKDELWHLGNLFNQMLEKNERLLQGMRETVDNVAHDLRTPVMRLQNSVEAALRGKSDLKLYQDALIDCQENSETILKLVNGIMDISEADAGTFSLKRELVNSSQLIESVIDLYGFVAEDKKIVLTPLLDKSFDITGDKTRLLQALANIVDNAIKYSPNETTIIIQTAVEENYGIIRISDQGPGVPAGEIDKIWDRLYRVDSSRSSKGLGLGLSLVKAIITAHQGTVGVYNNENSGTTFFVKIPV